MKKGKHDKFSPPFVAIEKSVWLRCEEWRTLSPGARDLYALLKCAFNGHNNGDIQLFYSQVRGIKGLASSRTVSKLFRELENSGWITATEKGGMYRKPNKYELTGRFDRMIG